MTNQSAKADKYHAQLVIVLAANSDRPELARAKEQLAGKKVEGGGD
jgi:hypothetical protein